METISWLVQPDGRYVIDAVVGGIPIRAMIDTGLVDPSGCVAFEVQPAVFEKLTASGQLTDFRLRYRLDAAGRRAELRTARVNAGLGDPTDPQKPFSDVVSISVACGADRVPNRVGTAFFHSLPGCSVDWNCSDRRWSIRLR